MPSLKSRLFCFMLNNGHLLRFQLKKRKNAWDFNTSIPLFRQECEKGAARFGKLPGGIEIEPLNINGIKAEWILPTGAMRDQTIFFIHGGGYVSGSCSDHRATAAKFVKGSGIRALLFEYRLAPEHPFPAAVDDSLEAYRWLLDQGAAPDHVVFAGDSAGGGLVLALLLALKDKGLHLPAAAVALSPWTDLKLTGESHRTNAQVCLSPPGMSAVCSKYYAGDNDPCLPYISPLYGEPQGLPPILIYVGGNETLLDDSRRFAAKAQAAGVDVTLRIGRGLFHCYPACAPLFPEATQAMREICDFIKTHVR